MPHIVVLREKLETIKGNATLGVASDLCTAVAAGDAYCDSDGKQAIKDLINAQFASLTDVVLDGGTVPGDLSDFFAGVTNTINGLLA